MPTTDMIAEVVQEVEEYMRRRSLFVDAESHARACLYWAKNTRDALIPRKLFKTVTVVAGSANFLMVPDELDDGVSHTHYSYEWSGVSEEKVKAILLGQDQSLPEMHVWLACFDEPLEEEVVIIDLTTRFLPELCAKAGMPWLTEPPPSFIWSKIADLPYKWLYRPNLEATKLANLLLAIGVS